MSNKFKQEFKNKINENKKVEDKKKIEDNSLIDKFFIRIDKMDNRGYKEAEMAVRDFISLKGDIVKGEILNLSEVCDMLFNLRYTGSKIQENKKELFFSIC